MADCSSASQRRLVAVSAAVWLTACVAGAACLWQYATKPGKPGQVAPRWPATSGIPVTTGKPTLLAFVHPNCPCSRATLAHCVNVNWLWFAAFVGANLLQSSVTKWCLMEDILRKLGVGGTCASSQAPSPGR